MCLGEIEDEKPHLIDITPQELAGKRGQRKRLMVYGWVERAQCQPRQSDRKSYRADRNWHHAG
ncbi:hypothetical protein ZHAS_00022087 [Anopheles sinensis]|uniref:Uncharacterized protein n=1 Tax=Anopheles sinensis TaxID=74873 RepID=A0A084WU17_ANOSI|nr:hypothetical protein ZHAS_00022087 [Anopheles sinensis]